MYNLNGQYRNPTAALQRQISHAQGMEDRLIESLRLEKISEITTSNPNPSLHAH